MKGLYAVLLVFSVIFVSGCTVPGLIPAGNVGSGGGVIITDFVSELNSVYSGESVQFELKLKNTGSFEADGTVDIDLGHQEWQCTSKSFGGQSFTDLIAPSEERGTEGEEFTVAWSCRAPEIDEGMRISYNARAEIEYAYKSLISKSVTLLPTNELIALRDSGQTLPSELISRSNSPVSIDIQIEGPIRIRDDVRAVEFPVNIIIENTGGGIVKDSKVNLFVEGMGGLTKRDCDHNDLALWKGQSQTITCRMSANNVDALTQSRIVGQIDYVYITSATATVEVEGTDRFGSF
ncbi:MAG: hypothetical protein JW789_02245 [Candidatus Aenigmarchaeota archaeon]|nr:hypothetical protein [Candidatus Aenigmarchaeota archaeon]